MKTNLLTLVVTLTLGVILCGSLLMPVIDDIQMTSGTPVTYTNVGSSVNLYHYDYVDSIDFTATAGDSNWTDITINGQEITLISDYMLAVISDVFFLQIGTSGQLEWGLGDETNIVGSYSKSEGTLKITFANGEFEVVGGTTGTLHSGEYSWVVTYVEDGSYVAKNGNPTGAYCDGKADNFILYSSIYTTGDLDTFYSYGKGVLSLGVSTYTGSVNLTTTLVDGTTDIYKVSTCNVTITDPDSEDSETFTPYRALIKETITGHSTSGAAHSLYAAIPIILIIGLVLAGVGAIGFKNRD